MSTSFHPQMDGASERSIRLVAQILQVLICPDQQDWLNKIPMVEFTLNSAISNSSGFAPFELNYGYMPSMNPGVTPEPSKILGVKYFITRTMTGSWESLGNSSWTGVSSREPA